MRYKLFYTSKAKKDLSNLDNQVVSQILDKIDFYIDTGEPFKYSKKLKNFNSNAYRFRVGDYRAIFDVDSKGNITILVVLRVKHRREVYL